MTVFDNVCLTAVSGKRRREIATLPSPHGTAKEKPSAGP
jgi:hypothetical protein